MHIEITPADGGRDVMFHLKPMLDEIASKAKTQTDELAEEIRKTVESVIARRIVPAGPTDPPANSDESPARAKMRKLRFRYHMIAAYDDRLVEEHEKLMAIEPDLSKELQVWVKHHRGQAAEAREHVAGFDSALGDN